MKTFVEEMRSQGEKISFPLEVVGIPTFPSELPPTDVQIVTSGGLRIPAHSSVLASVSTVLEKILDRPCKRRSSEKIIPILGVPCDAVAAFVRFLYTSRCNDEELERYGVHLLTLSHVFSFPKLKQRCTRELATRLTVENVVDVLQLARLCDAPDLYLKCMNHLYREFKDVQRTEGWKFVQDNDPYLELEILQFIDEAELRQKSRSRNREVQCLYKQLGEAMECLEHIFTNGCTNVRPHDVSYTRRLEPCEKFSTCQGLQVLIQHFAACKKRVNGKCWRCKRMWQLLRLHSSICDQTELCRVPLCRQFKLRMQLERKGDDGRWRLLVRKVISAKALLSLSLPTKNREGETSV